MRKSNPDSAIIIKDSYDLMEISRQKEKYTIIQVEPGSRQDDYIVEVLIHDAD